MKRTMLLYKVVGFLEKLKSGWKLEDTNFDADPKTVLLSKDGEKKEFKINEDEPVLIGGILS